MDVNRGWSVDYGKTRFDVTVQEVDLMALLVTHGCADPEGVRRTMDPFVVYRIMHSEAMCFVHTSMAGQEPARADEHRATARAWREQREKLLTDVLHPKKASDPVEPVSGG